MFICFFLIKRVLDRDSGLPGYIRREYGASWKGSSLKGEGRREKGALSLKPPSAMGMWLGGFKSVCHFGSCASPYSLGFTEDGSPLENRCAKRKI